MYLYFWIEKNRPKSERTQQIMKNIFNKYYKLCDPENKEIGKEKLKNLLRYLSKDVKIQIIILNVNNK